MSLEVSSVRLVASKSNLNDEWSNCCLAGRSDAVLATAGPLANTSLYLDAGRRGRLRSQHDRRSLLKHDDCALVHGIAGSFIRNADKEVNL